MNRLASFARTSPSPQPMPRTKQELDTLSLPSDITASVQAFLKNVQSPIHKSPFSPERLTAMFQDFYAGTSELIYDNLPEDTATSSETAEMLSKDEIAAQKELRQNIESKRQQWREEIEEKVCLELYDKIFELRTSNDELRDEALMSKIIAMNLIGVTLEQLGVGLSEAEWHNMQPTVTLIGEELQNLNNALTPKAKIDILVACHKQIVAEVQHTNIADDLAVATEAADDPVTQSGSSETRQHLGADAILPIFIFSIIKSNPAKLVSHFEFIQRFRANNMIAGESAYCLTNLEAAIGFLETFDDDHNRGSDPLKSNTLESGLGASNSSASLSTSLRASERARALSSAAQDVYDFADERMKSLGTQFGTQLGALVGRVSQARDIEDVRSLMGLLPAEENTTNSRITSPAKNSGKSLPPVTTLESNSSSPSKAMASLVQAQGHKPAASFSRLSGFGMIRNLSNSFSQARSAETMRAGAREMQNVTTSERSYAQ